MMPEETPATLKKRSGVIITRLRNLYPEADVALDFTNPLQLLIATILSAQCTDERVNKVTPQLFNKYKTADDFALAKPTELEDIIHSTGFYHSKAKNIIECCKTLVAKYNGKVPDSMEELTQLAGVGRKTANVILSHVFGKKEGIVVDTHVGRLAQRLGFSNHQNASKIEQDLMRLIPQKDWMAIDNLLIWHGRQICNARKPKCLECILKDLCPSVEGS